MAAAVSHARERLVFSRWSTEDNLWSVELDSVGGAIGVASPAFDSSRSERNLAFSNDGHLVAFESNRSGTDEIWRCGSDGSRCQQLTWFADPPDRSWPSGWRAGNPAWSPDGETIAFDGTHRDTGTAVYLVRAPGGKPIRLTEGFMPRWSRDGRWIYFIDVPPFTATNRAAVSRIASRGGEKKQLGPRESTVLSLQESQDGQWLYYFSYRGPNGNALHRIPSSGGEAEIGFDGFDVRGPHFVVGDNGIWSIDVDDNAGVVKFYDTTTRSSRLISKLPKSVFVGLTVSPDGRRLIVGQTDRVEADLMLVEGFR